MSVRVSASCRSVVILSACQSPGAEVAKAFADRMCHVVVMGGDEAGLTRIAASDPEHIEPLFIKGGQTEALHLLKDAWGTEPIDLVVNLMPLAYPHHLTEQLRALSLIMQTFGRGLVAGKGAIASVAARPDDPLSLVGTGMCAALASASMALGGAVAGKSVRVHTVLVPKKTPALALETLCYLGSTHSQHVKSTTFDLTP